MGKIKTLLRSKNTDDFLIGLSFAAKDCTLEEFQSYIVSIDTGGDRMFCFYLYDILWKAVKRKDDKMFVFESNQRLEICISLGYKHIDP